MFNANILVPAYIGVNHNDIALSRFIAVERQLEWHLHPLGSVENVFWRTPDLVSCLIHPYN